MLGGDVADQLLDDDRLADTGPAEDTDLAAAPERSDQVDRLDSGLEDLGLGLHLVEAGRLAVNRQRLVDFHRGLAVDRMTEDVEDPTQGGGPHRDRDRAAGVLGVEAARQAIRGRHGHRSHPVVAKVLLDLDDQRAVADRSLRALDLQRVVDGGQLARWELDVDHGTRDLDHLSGGHRSVLSPRAVRAGLGAQRLGS